MGEPFAKRARTSRSKGKRPSESEVDVFFSQEQKVERLALFNERKLKNQKLIDLSWFLDKGFVFPRFLIDQHLDIFCNLSGNIYPKLVKEFYANLVKRNGKWITEVRNSRISVSLEAIESAAGLQNSGESFFDLSRNNWDGFNPLNTFLDCMRPEKRFDGKLIGAGLLKVNDRLLHYVIVYILIPRVFNKAQLNSEDLKFMFALKTGRQVNWADVIWGHMLRRFKDSNGVLPYPALVSKLIINAGVDITNEAKLSLRKGADKIDSMTLKKMKIARVNGVWDWLDDSQPSAQNRETDEERETEIPESPHDNNPSTNESIDHLQGFMLEQISHLRADMNLQNRRFEKVEERLESMYTLMESLIASKEKESSNHSPPSKS